jgi:hypothetical protein
MRVTNIVQPISQSERVIGNNPINHLTTISKRNIMENLMKTLELIDVRERKENLK